jgi:GNAT superfamily N-acetyltransferase
MPTKSAPFEIDNDYTVSPLTAEDGQEVQALMERCSDHAELTMGLLPGPAEAQSLYAQLPEGKDYDDKILLGIYTAERQLVGVLDAVRDYPEPGEWYIGLLLLEPAQRRHGLGERVYRAFERWAASQGAQGIRLAVVEQNVDGERFWRRLGFTEIRRTAPQRLGVRDNVMIVMRRPVSAA